MNRRRFLKHTAQAALALGLGSSTATQALAASDHKKDIQWLVERKDWRSLGPVDLRQAAFILAVRRVASVTLERGIWP